MLPIKRAHSYPAIELLRNELEKLPSFLLESVAHYGLYVLPDALSPLWIGLLKQDTFSKGFMLSDAGGWCADEDHRHWVTDAPHIYIKESYVQYTILHEVGHALVSRWGIPIDDFYCPEKAFFTYMKTDADEYFACAFVTFFYPPQDDVHYNVEDLAKLNYPLFEFLVQFSSNST
jgi:hypothetical protein